MYRTVLLTTDGSDVAQAATAHAVHLASLSPDSTIVAISVIDTVGQLLAQATPSGWGYGGGGIAVEAAEAAVAAEREQAQTVLDALQAEFEAAGVAARTQVIEGHPGTAIVDAAAAEQADVIVMATHGRGGIGRAVLGSVADHVVRHATCPVLLVRPPRE